MATTLTLRSRTNAGDTTVGTALTYDQVDDNFLSLKQNKAELESPQFSGNPRTPTVSTDDSSTIIASTAFVHNVSDALNLQIQAQFIENDPIPMAIALG
jgi:hypothetical protein